jgi:peptidoglycan/xylan/chitin deacetylase (PgdA/CDA1 family)
MNRLPAWESWPLRAGATLLSRSGSAASLLVLIYHRVLEQPDPLLPEEPDRQRFARQLELLAANFRVLPLREAVARLARGALPARALCITFDDGYANNLSVAAPLLRQFGLPATVFVAPGFLNGGRMFNDTVIETVRRAPDTLDLRPEGLARLELPTLAARRAAIEQLIPALKYLEPAEREHRALAIAAHAGVTLPTDLMMTDRQVRALHDAGVEIGAHTMSHPILTRVDLQQARSEIVRSKQRLEEITAAPVRCFAYPNGTPVRDYDASHVALARELGFELALSTAWGAATAHSDRYQIPRIAPWDRTAGRYGLRLALGYRRRRFITV